jgi:hypothetical protein
MSCAIAAQSRLFFPLHREVSVFQLLRQFYSRSVFAFNLSFRLTCAQLSRYCRSDISHLQTLHDPGLKARCLLSISSNWDEHDIVQNITMISQLLYNRTAPGIKTTVSQGHGRSATTGLGLFCAAASLYSSYKFCAKGGTAADN